MSAPLTKTLGTTERTLQQLLARQLEAAGLDFPQWTVLVFLGNSPMERSALLKLLASGRVIGDEGAADLLDGMARSGLIAIEGSTVAMTEAGKATFLPLREKVQALTKSLTADIQEADLEATHRTLALVTARAESLLGA